MDLDKIYYPGNNDFLDWLNSDSAAWLAPDWDYYITATEANDLTLFKYANNAQYPKSDFCLHCLYYLVGEYHNNTLAGKTDNKRKARIEALLGMVEPACQPQLIEWKQKTTELLYGELKFDPEFWFNFLFISDIKKLCDNENTNY